MTSKLNNVVVPVDANYEDMRGMPGFWVIDQRGQFGVSASYDTDGRQAWFVSLDGSTPFTVHCTHDRVRALDLSLQDIEVVAGALRPMKLDDDCPLGGLVFTDEGACVVVQEHVESRGLERKLLNLVTRQFVDLNGQVRLGAAQWTLRGLRAGKTVLEHDIEAVEEVTLAPREPAQFRDPR